MPSKSASVVAVGGGHGTEYLVSSLKQYEDIDITCVTGVWDDGGHSGKLRRAYGVPSFGDPRRVMAALSHPKLVKGIHRITKYRFKTGYLRDESLGNLILFSMYQKHHGDLVAAFEEFSEMCEVQGKVFPVTLTKSRLWATLSDGSILEGEHRIGDRHVLGDRRVVEVHLDRNVHLYEPVGQAIRQADLIVLCAGSLRTSVTPHFLVDGFLEAILNRRGKLVYVVNIMNEMAETPEFKASDFARTVYEQIGRKIDVIVCNIGDISPASLTAYAREGSFPVQLDTDQFEGYCRKIIFGDFVTERNRVVRHSPRLAQIIADLAHGKKKLSGDFARMVSVGKPRKPKVPLKVMTAGQGALSV